MRVIEAYAQYHERFKNKAIPLVICGKGLQEEEMRAMIAKHSLTESIRIVPWLAYEQVPRASRLSRAVLLASTHDQWGMIVNEALAAGAPVLVSNRCGAHELVRNHVNGFTFDPFDAEHLGRLFGVLTDDEALLESMRQAAAPSMKDFSIDQWIENHFAVLEHYNVLPESRALMANKETQAVS